MTAFMNHATIELRGSIRNRQLLFLNYAFPLGFYVMMGLVMTGINPFFAETMLPAMLIFAMMAATLLGLPDPLVNAREAGIFRSYRIFGVPATNILLIPALVTILHVALVSLIIGVSAPLAFDAAAPDNWPWLIAVTGATALAHAGLAVLIGVISSSSRATILWSQLIFLPSMLVAGLMVPFDLLPSSIQVFARLFPATYAMNAYRGLAYGLAPDFSAGWSLLILLAGGLLAFGLAVSLFNWDRHNETRRGHPGLAVLALLPYALGALLLA